MPTGPTAKMAVLQLGFIGFPENPRNCRGGHDGRLQFLAPGPDAEDANKTAVFPERITEYRSQTRVARRPQVCVPQKTRSLDEGLAALNLARNNTPKEQFFRDFDRFALLRGR